MIVAVLTTAGRAELLGDTIASLDHNLAIAWGDAPVRFVIFCDDNLVAQTAHAHPGFEVVGVGPRRGYAAAMARAFAWLAPLGDYVWWTEDDFTLNRRVDTGAMVDVLAEHPYLAQLALRRQPWNDAERAAGGIVEQHPDWYTDHAEHGVAWLEHAGYYTNNPHLMAHWVPAVGYPTGKDAEGRFGFRLRDAEPDVRFGYWGSRDSGEWCHHTGELSVRGRF